LQDESHDEFEFFDWNAHAVYFYDPSVNIVEYIARHNIKSSNSTDEFTNNDILCISEVWITCSGRFKRSVNVRIRN
jgi:hypothetical protein